MAERQHTQTLPFARLFAGHETFAFRHFWLKKGLDHLLRDREVFQRQDATTLLGVGKNMVRSIRHWCLACRVAEEEPGTRAQRLRPTGLGEKLLRDGGWDPYLEDDASLWLLHWNLASAGARAATWYWAFNRFHEYAFTRPVMVDSLCRFLQAIGWADISDGTIARDVECLVHTYLPRRGDASNGEDPIGCPLTALSLLVAEADGERLRFRVGPKPSLPTHVFAFAVAQFWNQRCPERLTLDLRELLGAEGSPALVFRLDEDSVLSHLDGLADATGGAVRFEDSALVRRLVKRGETPLDSMSFLEAYYGSG